MSDSHIYAFTSITRNEKVPIEKKIKIIKECIDAGVDINYNDSMALIDAIQNEDNELVDFLIESGIDIRINDDDEISSPLRTACQISNFHAVKTLLSYGANPNSEINPPILEAIDLDIIKLFVEYGANPFLNDNVLLVGAVDDFDLRLIEYLISVGANVQCQNNKPIADIFDSKGNYKIKRLLLENGADPNTIFNKICLLELGIINADIKGCKMLFEFNADVNLCHNIISKNNTNVRLSKKNNKIMEEIINIFMDHGLDISEFVNEIYVKK